MATPASDISPAVLRGADIPAEILNHILFFVPDTAAHTLSVLLRVSKLFCRITAPRLYRNIRVTPLANILVDTNLRSDLLDDQEETFWTPEEVLPPPRSGGKDKSGRRDTVKWAFLDLIETVDVYPKPEMTILADELIRLGLAPASEPTSATSSLTHPSSRTFRSPRRYPSVTELVDLRARLLDAVDRDLAGRRGDSNIQGQSGRPKRPIFTEMVADRFMQPYRFESLEELLLEKSKFTDPSLEHMSEVMWRALVQWREMMARSRIHLKQLRLRLDTASYRRYSPIHQGYPTTCTLFNTLEILRPERLVLHGASFHQDSEPLANIPSSLLSELKEVILVITPGASPGADDMINMHHGIPHLLDHLCRELHYDFRANNLPPAIDITFVLQTPRPNARFPAVEPTPHGSTVMTMDYSSEYAPGYLHPLTTLVGQRLVVLHRPDGGPKGAARIGKVTFVNFGALEGYQVGMPQAAMEEMQERFEKGVRIRMTRAGIEKKKQELEVVGMREWLDGLGEDAEGVLDEDIMRGWKKPGAL